jgi:hypothetical protein
MSVYTIALERVRIDTLRSRGSDTDHIGFGLSPSGIRPDRPFLYSFLGDVQEGEHDVGLVFSDLFVADPKTPVLFSYQIVNGDNVDNGKLEDSMSSLSTSLTVEATSRIESGDEIPGDPDTPEYDDNTTSNTHSVGSGWMPLLALGQAVVAVVRAIIGIIDIINPNCNGMVLLGAVGRRKEVWDQLIDSAGGYTYRESVQYSGDKSPDGCGARSDYTVTWSITRWRKRLEHPVSLKDFLREHDVPVDIHIRRLAPNLQSFRLRDLLGLDRSNV